MPNKIWLSEELIDRGWESNKTTDTAYYSRDFIINLFSARVKEIEEEIKTINEYTMSGGQKVNRLRGIKKELKQWITTL